MLPLKKELYSTEYFLPIELLQLTTFQTVSVMIIKIPVVKQICLHIHYMFLNQF